MIILIVVLLAIPIILIIAIFTHKGIQAAAAIDINKPQRQVFDYLALLKNQQYYNSWLMIDPKMTREFTGTDGQPGFIYAWESKNKKDGKGSQKIAKVTSPEQIEVEITFEKPVPSKARDWFEL